jgi:hypothetical protein
MHLARREVYLVRILVAGRSNAAQYLSQFRLIIDELQQRLTMGAPAADPEDVFAGRIEVRNKEICIKQYYA